MKTHVLLGIVAFLVRPIWVLLAKAGCILRLLVRVEAHPRTTLQSAHTGAFRRNPFLGRSGKDQTRRVAGDSTPGRSREARSACPRCGYKSFAGFCHPVNSSGIQSTRSSATTTLKVTLRNRRAS